MSRSLSSLPEESRIAERLVLEIAFVVDAFTTHLVGGKSAFYMFVYQSKLLFLICYPSVKKSAVVEDYERN